MMLLDAHVLVWLIEGDDRLGRKAKAAIEQARADDAACVSAITPCELSMLVEKGRVRLSRPIAHWIDFTLGATGIRLVPLDPTISIDAGRLPDGIHEDPADRIIVATARALACPLLTADSPIGACAKLGDVAGIDAGR